MTVEFDEAIRILLDEHVDDWQDADGCWVLNTHVALPHEWYRRKQYFGAWRALRTYMLEKEKQEKEQP